MADKKRLTNDDGEAYFPKAMTAPHNMRWMLRTRGKKKPYSALKTKPEDYVDDKDGPDAWPTKWGQQCVCVDFDTARAALIEDRTRGAKRRFEGINYVLHPYGDYAEKARIICLDYDNAFDSDGKLWPEVEAQVAAWDGYVFVEYSRSGRGLHVFILTICQPFTNVLQSPVNKHCKVDILCSSQVACTGRVFGTASELVALPFSAIEKLPYFEYKRAEDDACDFDFKAEWWDQERYELTEADDKLVAEMREWPPSVEHEGADQAILDVARRLVREGIVGWRAVRLLEHVPSYHADGSDYPWDEDQLQHKVESAFTRGLHDQIVGKGLAPEFDDDIDASVIAVESPTDDEPEDEPETAVDADPGPLPSDLCARPGLLNELIGANLESALWPNLVWAAVAAAVIQAAIWARKVWDTYDTTLNRMDMLIGDSCSGKNHPLKQVRYMMTKLELDHYLGDTPASKEAIQTRLKEFPIACYVKDEASGLFAAMADARNTHAAALPTYLCELVTAGHSLAHIRDTAQERGMPVYKPHFAFLGAAVRSAFMSTINSAFQDGGLWGRIITAASSRGERNRNRKPMRVPERVLEFGQWSKLIKSENVIPAFREPPVKPSRFETREEKADREEHAAARQREANSDPELHLIPHSDAARELAEAYIDEMDAAYRAASNLPGGDSTASAYGRAAEIMNKFAMDSALSRLYEEFESDPETCFWALEINASDVQWAIRKMNHLVAQKLWALRTRPTTSNSYTELHDAVTRVLQNGRVSRAAILRAIRVPAENLFGFGKGGKGGQTTGGAIGTMIQSGVVRQVAETKKDAQGKERTTQYFELRGKK